MPVDPLNDAQPVYSDKLKTLVDEIRAMKTSITNRFKRKLGTQQDNLELPSLAGKGLQALRVNAAATALEFSPVLAVALPAPVPNSLLAWDATGTYLLNAPQSTTGQNVTGNLAVSGNITCSGLLTQAVITRPVVGTEPVLTLDDTYQAVVSNNNYLTFQCRVSGSTSYVKIPYSNNTKYGRLSLNANQAVAANTPTVVVFNTLAWSEGGIADVAAGTYKPNMLGYYLITAQVKLTVDATPCRIYIRVGGTVIASSLKTAGGAYASAVVSIASFELVDVQVEATAAATVEGDPLSTWLTVALDHVL